VWCDASSLATGVRLEIGGKVVEDAAWLRKENDGSHINLVELEAAILGVKMALKWELRDLTVMTDSATVFGWLQSVVTESHKVKTRGLGEMLVRRRLAIVDELCKDWGLRLKIKWLKSEDNKADELTRVKKCWLNDVDFEGERSYAGGAVLDEVENSHRRHHFGVDRTLYIAKQHLPEVSRKEVEDVVRRCRECNSIDPASIRWPQGTLEVCDTWKILSCDVTHYNEAMYLTVVDSGPSRFAIWRKILQEDAPEICK